MESSPSPTHGEESRDYQSPKLLAFGIGAAIAFAVGRLRALPGHLLEDKPKVLTARMNSVELERADGKGDDGRGGSDLFECRAGEDGALDLEQRIVDLARARLDANGLELLPVGLDADGRGRAQFGRVLGKAIEGEYSTGFLVGVVLVFGPEGGVRARIIDAVKRPHVGADQSRHAGNVAGFIVDLLRQRGTASDERKDQKE